MYLDTLTSTGDATEKENVIKALDGLTSISTMSDAQKKLLATLSDDEIDKLSITESLKNEIKQLKTARSTNVIAPQSKYYSSHFTGKGFVNPAPCKSTLEIVVNTCDMCLKTNIF